MESGKNVGSTSSGMSRREFSVGLGGACALLAVGGGIRVAPAQACVRPPGGQDENRLISSCIRCERCIGICPNGALAPAHLEDGVLGVRMPVANFDAGWCDWCADANGGVPLCVETCPTQALQLAEGATPENVIMGKAVIIEDWCLAYSKYNGCRFCYDACPYEAITLDEYERPVVDLDLCNGCGACQAACVSMEEGSIAEGATTRAIVVVPESSIEEKGGR
ncbi:MAG: 4Fe-4S dicluster domain-containing protein [Slackia sp.]|nr:4Fe-4S dicluster domain-containing protein [Slackia sp.]